MAEAVRQELEVHALADLFPAMSEDQYQGLVADIREHGVREPILLYEGKILDGRHRYRTCQELGLDCPSRIYEGDNPTAFVISLNLARRHLTESQRAMVSAKMANMPSHRPAKKPANLQAFEGIEPKAEDLRGEISVPQAAELLNVSERSVRSAKKVIDHGVPELQKAVEQGEVAVSTAAKVASLPEDEQRVSVAVAMDKVFPAQSQPGDKYWRQSGLKRPEQSRTERAGDQGGEPEPPAPSEAGRKAQSIRKAVEVFARAVKGTSGRAAADKLPDDMKALAKLRTSAKEAREFLDYYDQALGERL